MYCKFCGKRCKNNNSLHNHERLCKHNPNKNDIDLAGLKVMSQKVKCIYCKLECNMGNIKRHERACKSNPKNIKICPVCGLSYSKKTETCSYACSNTYFRHNRVGGAFYKDDDNLKDRGKYREICFRYHPKKCIVCGELKILAVHHINNNHDDNNPVNLVPLCPTHHVYVHSKYKEEVQPIIDKYIQTFIDTGIDQSDKCGLEPCDRLEHCQHP